MGEPQNQNWKDHIAILKYERDQQAFVFTKF